MAEQNVAPIDEWKTVIDAQMHFNDMLMRTRSIGSSVVLAAYGAAAVSVAQYPNDRLPLLGYCIHVGVVVMFFALLLLLSIFLLDYLYYYQLLIGAVERGEAIEEGLPAAARLTTKLSRRVSRRRARNVIWTFYGIPAVAGVTFLMYMLSGLGTCA
ncbi:MAG: hypothetical protein ACLQF1_20425 [Methyloceanibacter sp.]